MGSFMQETKKAPIVVIETNQGEIEIELLTDVAPKACENFLKLAENKYYEGVIFHRVIKNFMIQGGDPTGTGRGGASIWGKAFQDECSSDLIFDRPYLLAMANSGPNTNGSQFFITTVATPWLNGRHTIFGKVISGKSVVRKIEETTTEPVMNKPLEKQVILKVFVKEN
ncbi:MAG: peptidylprolyl isomerase [Chlamydiota bacterium]